MMTMSRARPRSLPPILLAALSAALLAQGAAADVYKWVDAQGHTHYADTPPDPGVTTSAVTLDRAATPTPAAAPDSAAKPAEAPAANTKTAALRGKMIGVEQVDNSPEAQRQREEACQRQKAELNLLSGGGRVFTLDANGERSYLDDDTRNARQAELQQQISSACK